jgi:hypothetical protein
MKKTHCQPGGARVERVADSTERAMAIVSEMLPPGSHVFPDAGIPWLTSAYLALDPPTRIHSR